MGLSETTNFEQRQTDTCDLCQGQKVARGQRVCSQQHVCSAPV